MNHFIVRPSTLKGEIQIPPSKSHTLRAILYGAMGKGKTVIHRYLPSPDAFAMIDACRHLGATITCQHDSIEIFGLNGKISGAEDVIQAGNSGLVLRFMTAISALGFHPIVITGDQSIRNQRPMQPLLDGLTQLGVQAISTRDNGFAPIIVKGPLHGGHAGISGEDSQPVSALLMAAAFASQPTELFVSNAGEKPWIDLTLSWFDRLGIAYERQEYSHYRVYGQTHYDGFSYDIPGDLSSIAFPLAAALITQSEIVIQHVDLSDPQGDKKLIDVFRKMGARIEVDANKKTLTVRKSPHLHGLKVDINDFIDSITILATVACFAEGETHILNAEVARQKECDRIHCITKELQKMGADIQEEAAGLIIKGGRKLHAAAVNSYHDHRMAMSLAVAALGAEGETRIDSISCVKKTFPTFCSDFQNLGADIKEMAQ